MASPTNGALLQGTGCFTTTCAGIQQLLLQGLPSKPRHGELENHEGWDDDERPTLLTRPRGRRSMLGMEKRPRRGADGVPSAEKRRGGGRRAEDSFSDGCSEDTYRDSRRGGRGPESEVSSRYSRGGRGVRQPESEVSYRSSEVSRRAPDSEAGREVYRPRDRRAADSEASYRSSARRSDGSYRASEARHQDRYGSEASYRSEAKHHQRRGSDGYGHGSEVSYRSSEVSRHGPEASRGHGHGSEMSYRSSEASRQRRYGPGSEASYEQRPRPDSRYGSEVSYRSSEVSRRHDSHEARHRAPESEGSFRSSEVSRRHEARHPAQRAPESEASYRSSEAPRPRRQHLDGHGRYGHGSEASYGSSEASRHRRNLDGHGRYGPGSEASYLSSEVPQRRGPRAPDSEASYEPRRASGRGVQARSETSSQLSLEERRRGRRADSEASYRSSDVSSCLDAQLRGKGLRGPDAPHGRDSQGSRSSSPPMRHPLSRQTSADSLRSEPTVLQGTTGRPARRPASALSRDPSEATQLQAWLEGGKPAKQEGAGRGKAGKAAPPVWRKEAPDIDAISDGGRTVQPGPAPASSREPPMFLAVHQPHSQSVSKALGDAAAEASTLAAQWALRGAAVLGREVISKGADASAFLGAKGHEAAVASWPIIVDVADGAGHLALQAASVAARGTQDAIIHSIGKFRGCVVRDDDEDSSPCESPHESVSGRGPQVDAQSPEGPRGIDAALHAVLRQPGGSVAMQPGGSLAMQPGGSFVAMQPCGSFAMQPCGSFAMQPCGSFGAMQPSGSLSMRAVPTGPRLSSNPPGFVAAPSFASSEADSRQHGFVAAPSFASSDAAMQSGAFPAHGASAAPMPPPPPMPQAQALWPPAPQQQASPPRMRAPEPPQQQQRACPHRSVVLQQPQQRQAAAPPQERRQPGAGPQQRAQQEEQELLWAQYLQHKQQKQAQAQPPPQQQVVHRQQVVRQLSGTAPRAAQPQRSVAVPMPQPQPPAPSALFAALNPSCQ